MLKINKITISGFRGIINRQDLLLENGNSPTSLAIYGLNSSGKSSFVDGLEWFLSPSSEIEWLKRENAGCHAYPHQEAQEGETFVEIVFSDSNIGQLRKTYNNRRITIPTLSSDGKFESLYKIFTVRPYLRYLEIIDFVFNRTGVEKYQKLANWMGFENELAFQEVIALGIIPNLKLEEENLKRQKSWVEAEIKKLIQNDELSTENLLNYCNDLLKQIGQEPITSLTNLPQIIKGIESKMTNSNTSLIAVISRVQANLEAIKLDDTLNSSINSLDEKVKDFSSKKEFLDKIDYVNIYEKAAEILDGQDSENAACPVCGLSWNRQDLVKHIKEELTLLKEIKESHSNLIENIKGLKQLLLTESESIGKVTGQIQMIRDVGINTENKELTAYKTIIDNIISSLDGKSIFDLDTNIGREQSESQSKAIAEVASIKDFLEKEKNKLQPNKEAVLLNDVTEKLKLMRDKLSKLSEIDNKFAFYTGEINKFSAISDEFFQLIQEDIIQRFKNMSSMIEKYFKILRPDKDIKGIEIVLNLDRVRAAGRSAEIQLSYYDLFVKPAYKVLSESLLNSLGLAVYFTCLKTFNTESKFVVLDDVMNSLDVGHRDTLLDLIEQEFSDYQVVLFTHDLFWFDKIQRRFPRWLHKKIKSWSYLTGPQIDKVKPSLEEVKELLKDATKAHDAGRNLGVYIETVLNELCEQLQAELRYRYTKSDPPTLEELFIALHKRLKEKLNNNVVVNLVQNAQKYEPILRNATSHSRNNYPSSISPTEVERALDEWGKLEKELWCTNCNRFVEYNSSKNQIECRCGNLKLDKVD